MAIQYTLTVKNESSLCGSVCVYQRCLDQKAYENLYSLAWFSKGCNPGTTLKFRWGIDYSFVWSKTGRLKPGVFFDASEVKDADPSNLALNATGFSRNESGYLFTSAPRAANKGSLDIIMDKTIPAQGLSVGIGMSGQSTFALEATPNFTYSFMPHPEYWVAFGDFQEGQVLDLNKISCTANVKYPVNTYSKTLVFQEDNTWGEAVTLKESNAKLLEKKD